MVTKASEDLPEPETPVTTVSRPTGMEKEMFLRLLTRAPRTSMASSIMSLKDCHATQRGISGRRQTHMITRIFPEAKRTADDKRKDEKDAGIGPSPTGQRDLRLLLPSHCHAG